MSLIKLLKIPSKLFKKDVITFLKIRRYDFGVFYDKLHYIAIKPSATISQLRQKVWHLLDLPDYCEEIIILKTEDGKELPLTFLCKGNDPQHPYYLEVYLPGKEISSSPLLNNMITMDKTTIIKEESLPSSIDNAFEDKINREYNGKSIDSEHLTYTAMTNNQTILNTIPSNLNENVNTDYRKSEMSSKTSTTSIFFKIHGRKSRDNFANILLKIQSDLVTLSNKLSDLENKIHV